MTNYNENQIDKEEEFETCNCKPPKRILIVVTNHDHFDEHHKTGVWFEEFALPYLKLKEEGCFVTVSSLKGGKAPLDPASEKLLEDLKWHEAKKALEDTTPLESIDYKFYDALILPGGHGPMFDLAHSSLLGEIVSYFNENCKLIAAICHGPAGLLTAEKNGIPFVKDRKITALTDEEEINSKKNNLTPFSLEDALKEKGAMFVSMPDGAINVVEDDNLITAQNYQSTECFTQAVVNFLQKN